MKIRIIIRKKVGVLDIEGKAVKTALQNLEIKNISDVSKGMFVEIDFTGSEAEVPSFVNEVCEKLLVNDVIESFEYEILK
jgi:phosphoribosylformylglycinamidine synthase